MKTFVRAAQLLGVLALGALAQIQSVPGKGSIDWGGRTVTAVGIGAPNPAMPEVTARPMAIRAARDVALRNALELIKGVQMTSSTTIENFMVSNDVVRSSVEGYIRKFEASEPRYMSDKTIEITVTIPLDAEALLPSSVTSAPTAQYAGASAAKSRNFTGLIIDARGTGAIPALAPKITDENGREIYGSAYVSREWAVKWGMAGYAKTPEQATALRDRVGDQPGMIKALKATGASKCDLVISTKDASEVAAASKSMKFLSDCRVIVLVD
jgi:hypothetical protein